VNNLTPPPKVLGGSF